MKNTKKIHGPATIEDVGLEPAVAVEDAGLESAATGDEGSGSSLAVEDVGGQYAATMTAESEKYKLLSNQLVAQLCLFTRGKRIKLVDVARKLGVTAPTVQNYKKKGTAPLSHSMRWANLLGFDMVLVERVVSNEIAEQDDDSIIALPWDDNEVEDEIEAEEGAGACFHTDTAARMAGCGSYPTSSKSS